MERRLFQLRIWSLLRIGIGLIFLWAFFDKLIGLGFSTCLDAESGVTTVLCDNAWIMGGSPTYGFLTFGTHGPFASIFQSLAGVALVDWLFMLGLLGVGLTLTLGFMVRFGSHVGVVILSLMWLAVLPPEHHPFIDDHVIYALVLLGIAHMRNVSAMWGIGKWWRKKQFVRNNPYWE